MTLTRHPTLLRNLVATALLAAVAASAGCTCVLPERFAVNAPMLHQMLGFGGPGEPTASAIDERMQAADGLSVGVYAADLVNVRELLVTPAGHLLASQPREGRLVLIAPDRDRDGRSDGTRVLLEGLDRPHGLDYDAGWLYVGLGGSIARARFDDARAQLSGALETVVPDLPEGGNHWTRTVRVRDGWMYVTVGSSCNVCEEEDERRAAMLRFRPDGSEGEVFARGLRNSVGFDFQPGTGAIYATDNGRDLLGDDFPPCELNLVERGAHYGWPYVNGAHIADPDFGALRPELLSSSRPPAFGFNAHNAPLGIQFIRGESAPASLRGAALVALHGSWNRTRKDGYKVVSLHWGRDGQITSRDFLTGFNLDDDVIGRPVDVAEAADGSIFVSDDYADVIWRVSAHGSAASPALGASAATAGRGDPLMSLSPSERASALARGNALYAANACASCHEDAHATPGVVVVDLANKKLSERHDIASLARFLDAPTPPMPRPPLDDAERRALAIKLLADDAAR